MSTLCCRPTRRRLAGAIALAMTAVPAAAQLELRPEDLDGSNGFAIQGAQSGDTLGLGLGGAGDANGDGVSDLAFGANRAGTGLVLFGSRQSFPALLDTAFLENDRGLIVPPPAGSTGFGNEVGRRANGVGDVSGDGLDDIAFCSEVASPDGRQSAGRCFVVFGSDEVPVPAIDPAALDGTNGFVVQGVAADDRLGLSAAGVGDVNGDTRLDLIIGASGAGGSGGGEAYVIFGRSDFPSSIDPSSLTGNDGFLITGGQPGDRTGTSVAGAGDINGDGFADVIIGANYAANNGEQRAGLSYIVFGTDQGFPAAVDLSSLDGEDGFRINGIGTNDFSGRSVAGAGDVNGDGISDVVIGANGGDPGDNGVAGRDFAGEVFVLFGSRKNFPSVLNLSSLDGSNGFVINGVAAGDGTGNAVAGVGDMNGDGVDDLLVGATGVGDDTEGAAYLVYGSRDPFARDLELSTLDGDNGKVFLGAANDYAGYTVSAAGDINGDGIDDAAIGAPNTPTGRIYVLFGSADLFADGFETGPAGR